MISTKREQELNEYAVARERNLYKGTIGEWDKESEYEKTKIRLKIYEMGLRYIDDNRGIINTEKDKILEEKWEKKDKECKKPLNVWQEIDGTPLHLITTDYEECVEYRIALGTYLVTNKVFTDKKEAWEYAKKPNWDVLENFINIVINKAIENITK